MLRILRQFPERFGSAFLTLCALGALWGGVAFHLASERRQLEDAALQSSANLSRAFEAHIIRSIETVDQTLLNIRDSYTENPARFDLAQWAHHNRMLTDLILQVSIIGRDGFLRETDLGPITAPIDLRDRAHFRVHADSAQDDLFISKPVLGRASGKWSIQLTRRINAPNGSFDGVIVASLDPNYLSRLYESIDVGKGGIVTLVGTDGVIRARAPLGEEIIGRSLFRPLQPTYQRSPFGHYFAHSEIDDIERLISYRKVRGYPLIVCIGLAKRDYLAPYYRDRVWYLAIVAALSLLVLLAKAVFDRHRAGLLRARSDLLASKARLAQKSHLLELTLENMSQGIIMVGRDHDVQVCNGRAAELLGLPEGLLARHPKFEEITRWQWDSGEFGENGCDVEEWMRRMIIAGGMSHEPLSYERRRPNGTFLEIRGTPLSSGGLVRTYTDITERKKVEEELRAARDEARRATRTKSDFLAMISHEIRSPLASLLGILDLLRDTPLNKEQSHMVELTRESGASLLAVLNDVLDFSKIEAGAVAIAPVPTDIEALVKAVLEPMMLWSAKTGIRLEYTIAADLPKVVSVDALRLRQILTNLVNNAVKFTPSGAVSVSVTQAAPTEGAPMLQFVVKDTGVGISQETLSRLFEPFTQADASTARDFGGTGLGLSISRRLARLMGGDLLAESRPDEGSTFTLRLPLDAASEASVSTQGQAQPIDVARLADARVLIVEDDATNRYLIRHQFDLLGIAADIVENGYAALAALAESRYDILITDCHMPGMDGTTLAARIRGEEEAESRATRLPILGLTADVTLATRERCLAAGMNGVLIKPTSLSCLADLLRQYVLRDPASKAPRAPEAPAGDAVFDDCTYRELFEEDDRRGREWLESYRLTAETLLERLEESAAAGDRDRLEADAHRLAGTSLSIGAMQMGIACRNLEVVALRAGKQQIRRLLEETRMA